MTLGQLLRAAGGIDGGEGAEFSVRVFRTPHDPTRPAFFMVAGSIDDLAEDDFELRPNDVVLIGRTSNEDDAVVPPAGDDEKNNGREE